MTIDRKSLPQNTNKWSITTRKAMVTITYANHKMKDKT